MNQRHPAIEASFEGHTGIFGIDTGAPNSFLTMHKPTVDALALLHGRDTNKTSVAGVGGRLQAVSGELDWFDFGGTRFEGPRVVFAIVDKGSYGGAYTMGTVGGRVIENFKMITDYSSRRIAFTSQ